MYLRLTDVLIFTNMGVSLCPILENILLVILDISCGITLTRDTIFTIDLTRGENNNLN